MPQARPALTARSIPAPAEPERPTDIDAWLVQSGFARVGNGDRLVATEAGVQAGAAIADALGVVG